MFKKNISFNRIAVVAASILLVSGITSCGSNTHDEHKAPVVATVVSNDVTVEERQEFWDSISAICFPGQKWDSTTFVTNGKVYADFVAAEPSVNTAMIAMYSDVPSANKYLPGVIKSGNTYPQQIYADSADMYYKIVPKGGAIVGSYSPYYLSQGELNWVKAHPADLEQKLGLPLSSVSGSYDVFTITSQKDSNVLFQSRIAPTQQYANATPAIIYSTPGGGIQSLIINNADNSTWIKSTVRTDSIVPDCLPNI